MQSEAPQKTPTSFCPAPFQSFVQDYNGQCGPCPYQAGAWDFKKVAFEDRWNSPEAQSLRQEHLNGLKSPVCRRCYIEEEAGFRSRRIAENEWNPHSFQNVTSAKGGAGLETMVLRLSNKCNYACRTCHSVDSSLFKKEGQYYAETYGDRGNRYIEREARAEFTAEQMQELCKLTSHLRELQFYGGEPMLNKTHYVLLQHLIDQGRAPEVALFYCTNASLYPSEQQIALWKNFRAVHLHLSLDAVGEQYHFVRWPGKWENVSANIQRWKNELAPQFGGRMTFGSNTTVSSMNVYDIPEIYACLTSLFGDKAAITTVHDPSYFSIIHLPREIKDKIAAKLQNSEHAKEFTGIVDFMNEREMDKNEFRDFVHWTEKMDAYRKVKFAEYFPDYFGILQPHYDAHAKTALVKKHAFAEDLKSSLATAGLALKESAASVVESLKEASQRSATESWQCSYSWSQIVTDPRGRVKPCSRFQPGQKFTQKISKAPIEKILNSPDFRELRRQMNSGQVPAGCTKCQLEESAGISSLRQKANRRNPLRANPGTRITPESISAIEFFLGDECNLKCRTCDHLHSSSIFQEEKNRGILHDPAVGTDLSVVKKFSKSLRSVKINGGEPFLMDRHLELLKLLVAEGNPGEISVSYNTNATVFPSQEVLSLWKHFQKVTVAVSVDGAGKLNNYIRFPSRWETVEQVTRRYAALAGEQENFHLSAICTVSAYNLHGIAGLMRWWKEIAGGSERLAQSSVTLNFVREPALMAANVLPAPLKLEACERLQDEFPDVAKRVRAFVLARDGSDLLEQFVARTRKLDRIRGQSVVESIPELCSVFGEAKASPELSYQL